MLIKGPEDLGNLVEKLMWYYVGTTEELKEKVDIWGYYLHWIELAPTVYFLYNIIPLNVDRPMLYSLPFAVDYLSRLLFRANDVINPEKTHNPIQHTPNIVGKMKEILHSYQNKPR